MENTTQPQLTVTDLASMKQIIEASTSRGTWQASEMRGIGELYERLVGFLDSVAPQPASTQEPEPAHTQGESND